MSYSSLVAPLAALIITIATALFVWRRNTVVYRMHAIHFCGEEMAKKIQWRAPKEPKRPVLNALDFRFRNIGFKHLDNFAFTIEGVKETSHICYHHSNSMAEEDFSLDFLPENRIRASLKSFPAFEQFGVSILEGNHYSGYNVRGASGHYKIIEKGRYVFSTVLWFIVASYLVFAANFLGIGNAIAWISGG